MRAVEAMTNDDTAYILRAGGPDDESYVRDTWRRSYGDGARAQAPDLETYIRTQNQIIDVALATSEVLIAHWPGEPRQICAWVCFRRPSTVHFVYVKQKYRRNYYARALLDELHELLGRPGRVYVTHHWKGLPLEPAATRLSEAAWKRGVEVRFNPGLVFA